MTTEFAYHEMSFFEENFPPNYIDWLFIQIRDSLGYGKQVGLIMDKHVFTAKVMHVCLVGSRYFGTHCEESDTDLALTFNDPEHEDEIVKMLMGYGFVRVKMDEYRDNDLSVILRNEKLKIDIQVGKHQTARVRAAAWLKRQAMLYTEIGKEFLEVTSQLREVKKDFMNWQKSEDSHERVFGMFHSERELDDLQVKLAAIWSQAIAVFS